MAASTTLRRSRRGLALASTVVAVTLLSGSPASAVPIGAPVVGGDSAVYGTGCAYAVGIRVGAPGATEKADPAGNDAGPAGKKADPTGKKAGATGWVTFWEAPGAGKPGAPGSKRIGRAKPNAKGVAIVKWTPQTAGSRTIRAYQKGWSRPTQVSVVQATSVGHLCVLSQ